jgi:hypothetical protein
MGMPENGDALPETDELLNRTGHSTILIEYAGDKFIACFGGQDGAGNRQNDFRVKKVGGACADDKSFQYEESMAY